MTTDSAVVSMLPLALMVLVMAGCSAQPPSNREIAASGAGETALAERDLTLQSPAASPVEIASPVELSGATPRTSPTRRGAARRAPAPTPAPVQAVAVPVQAVAIPQVAAEPAPGEDVAMGAGRELAPGKTVTVIPASSGPSLVPEVDESWVPSRPAPGIMVGGGDTCRGRGGARGIGIAGRIPIGAPHPRLR